MSLATRCPSCGTVFRVVQDQLRISEGWVRCGRCNAVFDATEVLFDIDLGTPVLLDLTPPAAARPMQAVLTAAEAAFAPLPAPEGNPSSPPEEPLLITDWSGNPDTLPAPPPAATPAPPAASLVAHPRIEPSFDAAPAGPLPPPLPSAPQTAHLLRSPSDDSNDEIHFSDGGLPPAFAGPSRWAPAPAAAPAAPPAVPAHPPAGDDPALAPSFLQAADRAARWRRPGVRLGLAIGVGVLAVAAVLQAALLERDRLAAQWPGTAPGLRTLCRLAGCQVQPPRRIDAITVDSSALGRLDGDGQYRLQLVLRNRADIALLPPALELSLTDGQGKLVMRRVLPLADLGLRDAALPARQSVTLQAVLAAGKQRIDGYTVELFYP